jgi:hypothetical protein
LAQKAEIDEKIAAAEQQKVLQDQKSQTKAQPNLATPDLRVHSASQESRTRPKDVLVQSKNSNRTAEQRRHEMIAMMAKQNLTSLLDTKVDQQRHHRSNQNDEQRSNQASNTRQVE